MTTTPDLQHLLDDASTRQTQREAKENQQRLAAFQNCAERTFSEKVRQSLGGWAYGVDAQMPRPYSAYAGFTLEAGDQLQPYTFHLYLSDKSADFRLVQVAPGPRQQAEVHTEDDLLITLRAWLPAM